MQGQDRRKLPCGCSAEPEREAEQIGELEGVVLRELLTPPSDSVGHLLEDLARDVHRELVLVEAVVGRLVAKGLVERDGDTVRPSVVAVEFQRINAGWG